MGNVFVFTALVLIAFLSDTSRAQLPQSPLDRYLDSGKTIVIARCLDVGPPNILLRSKVKIQVLYVVKGRETLGEIWIDSQFEMITGQRYLLKTESEASPDKRYFTIDSVDSVIPVWRGEDIEKLKTLSPRIVVLRTMNLRVDDLENEKRRIEFELETLKNSQREN